MDLTEVQKAMVPGATEALRVALTYHVAREAFTLALVEQALQECKGNQRCAARKLGITEGMVSQIKSGKKLKLIRDKEADPQ